jgi:chitinase
MAGMLLLLSFTASAQTRIFAPYQDVSLTGTSAGVLQNNLPALSAASGIKHFSMAFISSAGNACNPEWGGLGTISSDTIFIRSIRELREHGGDVIISFGGAQADNTAADGGGPDFDLAYGGGCATVESLQAAYQAVIDKYSSESRGPVPLDFDIEGDADGLPILNGVNTVDLRNRALAALAKANPGLKISFTLPVAQSGFLSSEIAILKSAIRFKVPVAVVNIMPFDFGAPISPGQYGSMVITAAVGALDQLRRLGMDSALGITVLIGTNDENDETFLLEDARTVELFAERDRNIQRLAFWEVSRDNGSCGNAPSDLDDINCSSITQGNWAFAHIFEAFHGHEHR